MDEFIKEIIEEFDQRQIIEELEMETNNGWKLKLKKDSSKPGFRCSKKVANPDSYTQTSKLVGTFRKMLVEINGSVKKNQPVAQIEVLKVINEVLAETDGLISEIFVKNDQPVEYSEPLFEIIQTP